MVVVLDTNVLVSACWTSGGLEDRVVQMALAGEFQIAITTPVWEEYAEVLARRKMTAIREKSLALLARLEAIALRVESDLPVSDARDYDDNRFLECALASDATFLVTGNLKDYPAHWSPSHVVNARQFLEALGREPAATV